MIVAGLKIHSHRALAPNSKKRIVSINPELRILTLRNQRFLLRCNFSILVGDMVVLKNNIQILVILRQFSSIPLRKVILYQMIYSKDWVSPVEELKTEIAAFHAP
jgi:hypothetical protein